MPTMQEPKQYLCRVGPLLGIGIGVFSCLRVDLVIHGNVGVYQTHTLDRRSAHFVDHNNQTATHALPNCQKNQENGSLVEHGEPKNIEQR